jgi:hypothetical protein
MAASAFALLALAPASARLSAELLAFAPASLPRRDAEDPPRARFPDPFAALALEEGAEPRAGDEL